MTEDSRDDLRARVRKLNAISEAMKNHPLPPHVSEMAAKLEEKVRYLSWREIQEQRAELQAKAAEREAAAPKPPAVLVPVLAESARVIHSTKEPRRNTLTPVIEHAQKQCRNPYDAAEVWGALLALAEKQEKPLLGATPEGLQYLEDGTAGILTRDALQKRLKRAAGKRR